MQADAAGPAVDAARQSTLAVSAAGTAWAVVYGVVIVGLLILAFWWGARRRARGRRTPLRTRQRRADSWHEPQPGETRHSMRSHGEDDEHR
jgi:hypothetical protein